MNIVHTGIHENLRYGMNGGTHATNMVKKMEYEGINK